MISYKHVFFSHRYRGELHSMIGAIQWVGHICDRFYIVPVVPWIPLCLTWGEERRELGLAINGQAIRKCSHLFLLGDYLTAGMIEEREMSARHGVVVCDFLKMSKIEVVDMLIESGWTLR
jgi:hypothetical protein